MFLNSLIVAYKLQFALLCSVEITLANIIISDKQLTKQGCMLEFSNPPPKKKEKKKRVMVCGHFQFPFSFYFMPNIKLILI